MIAILAQESKRPTNQMLKQPSMQLILNHCHQYRCLGPRPLKLNIRRQLQLHKKLRQIFRNFQIIPITILIQLNLSPMHLLRNLMYRSTWAAIAIGQFKLNACSSSSSTARREHVRKLIGWAGMRKLDLPKQTAFEQKQNILTT